MEHGYCEACQCGGEIDCIFEEWGNEVQKKCFCPTGYMQDKDGLCSKLPHCEDENLCPNSTVCVNTNEGYKCVCKEGFRPLRKNADPKDFGCEDICGQNKCLAGECEITGDHYRCRCQDGYAGTYCEVELDIYPKKKSLVAAFSILATIIIVLLITTVFFARKIRVP
ncbi:latent-transforming growth factor beta-binding protein 2-like [Stegodyphus dumicola]|uniref:latent-transforming growth factor beta-binding protein 2-like n=1 Tax=Stegodyphus dumicola TaxID=202533 RepID=UPI0015A8F8B4|nr:latent-transforming growth factor beta-binding protein 2-like [Stegodyphus dumicola]